MSLMSNSLNNFRVPDSISIDAMLVQKVRCHDPDAMSEVFNLHHKRIYSAALRILKCPLDAEDVVQEVLIRFWNDSSRYNPDNGKLSTWFASVARNRAVDIQRRKRKSDYLDFCSVPSTDDHSRYAECGIQMTLLNGLIDKLPELQRSMLRLAFRDELSHLEISNQVGIPMGTVKTRIRKGIQRLRRSMPN